MRNETQKDEQLPHNKLALIRLGLFSPEMTSDEMQQHFIWKLWEVFKDYCRSAKIEKREGVEFKVICEEEERECTFSGCPALGKAIKRFTYQE